MFYSQVRQQSQTGDLIPPGLCCAALNPGRPWVLLQTSFEGKLWMAQQDNPAALARVNPRVSTRVYADRQQACLHAETKGLPAAPKSAEEPPSRPSAPWALLAKHHLWLLTYFMGGGGGSLPVLPPKPCSLGAS